MVTKIRALKKYNISKYRFREVLNHCYQYNEWKAELAENDSTLKARAYTGMPSGSGSSNETEALAIRRMELKKKIETIEQTAIEADAELYPYIIKAVTNEWATFRYLKDSLGMPCEKDMFYERRRRFYYLMSKKI